MADDDTVPGFGGGSSELPGLGSGGGGFRGGAGTGSGLMANDRGRQNGPLMSSPRWMIKGRVADGKSMIALIGRAVAMGQTVGTSAAVVEDAMAVGIRQDLGRWNGPSGARRGGRY